MDVALRQKDEMRGSLVHVVVVESLERQQYLSSNSLKLKIFKEHHSRTAVSQHYCGVAMASCRKHANLTRGEIKIKLAFVL